jgi:hypothetical protein
MFKKSILAIAAIAAVVSVGATAAQADPHINFGIGFGVGAFPPPPPPPFFPGDGDVYGGGYSADYPGYMPRHRRRHFNDYPVYDQAPSYGVSCNGARNVVREAGFRNVRAYDCSAPTYGYKAWRDGELFQVKVSYQGDIISVRPIY